jgi:hypothetical protein
MPPRVTSQSHPDNVIVSSATTILPFSYTIDNRSPTGITSDHFPIHLDIIMPENVARTPFRRWNIRTLQKWETAIALCKTLTQTAPQISSILDKLENDIRENLSSGNTNSAKAISAMISRETRSNCSLDPAKIKDHARRNIWLTPYRSNQLH